MAFRKYIVVPLACFTFAAAAAAAASSEPRALGPSVTISNGTVVGSSLGGVDSFLGIPYAIPPTGTRRLRPPTPLTTSFGTFNAVGVPAACPQAIISINTTGLPSNVTDLLAATPLGQSNPIVSEDCLTINVQRPANIPSGTKLPVVFWIFGGAFAFGSTSMYDGTSFVQKSNSLNAPVIYVAVNYRVAAFGFLNSRELQRDGSTNLGLRDQRLGLQWVADNIAAFGGDPDKVTLWGESAGALSVYDHSLINRGNNLYKGKPLFRGAIMNSGSAVGALDVTSAKPQAIYDSVVAGAGCSSASDTLQCLRSVPFARLNAASNAVPSAIGPRAIDLSYLPRPDPHDDFFPVSPSEAGIRTPAAFVPSIIGDQEDEGTLFTLSLFNITNTNALVNYLQTYFPLASRSQIQSLVNTYPEDPAAGSPFRTGILNQLYPGYKRNAALLGDYALNLARRMTLNIFRQYHPSIPVWSYLASYLYGTPLLGTFHISDIVEIYFGLPYAQAQAAHQTYYISFINYLDPNRITTAAPLIPWPQWQASNPQLLNLLPLTNQLIPDDYRAASYNVLRSLRDVLLL